jgi:hypothetical protein
MSIYQWFCVFLFVQIVHRNRCNGRKRWEGLSNSSLQRYCIDEIIGRPTWWTLLLFNYKPNYVSSNLDRNIKSFGKNQA